MLPEYTYRISGKNVELTCADFDLARTLDCGQAFRFSQQNGLWSGVALSRELVLSQSGNKITFHNVSEADFLNLWVGYFDLERNYGDVCRTLSADSALKEAVSTCPGIRIMRQDPFETLISFIISQNNNIPRIKGIVSGLCKLCGGELSPGVYAFPTPEAIAALGTEGLAPIRAGFRAKYIIDAAQRVAVGETLLSEIAAMPIEQARTELMKIKGVGPKVAECCLLYGMGRVDAFPVDVWVKRIMGELYPEGLPACTKGVEGIAQQYLFHWRRTVCR